MNLDVLTLDRRSGALLATKIVTIAANALQVSQRVQASQLMEEPSKKGQEPSKKSDLGLESGSGSFSPDSLCICLFWMEANPISGLL